MLNTAQKYFGTAAGGDQRIVYTLPPLVFVAYNLVCTYQTLQEEVSSLSVNCLCLVHDLLCTAAARMIVHGRKSQKARILKFCHEMIFALVKNEPEVCFRLFVQGALVADQIHDETITCEFVS